MHKFRYLLYLLSLTILVSCNSENTVDESELAYSEYRDFVTEVENDTAVTESDINNNWQARTDTLRQTFDRHKSGVVNYMDSYTPERREEVNAFDERVEVAFEQRQKRYDEVSHRYELRKKMLNMEVSEDDMSSIDAGNIVATYTHFVNTLEKNIASYTTNEWQLIEGWWSALRNRKEAVSQELQAADKAKLDQLEQTYQQLREQALNRLSE